MRARLLLIGLCLLAAGCSKAEYRADLSNNAGAAEETAAENGTAAAIDNAANASENMSNAGNGAGPIENGSVSTVQPCPAIRGITTTVARCANLTAQKQNLENGVAAFNPPRTMTMGKPTRVILPIGPKAEERDVVIAAGGSPGTAVRVAVKIGEHMTATLTGSAFKIVPVGDPRRDLGLSSSETWEWDVTPTAEGNQTLRVEIETFAEDDQGKRTRIALFRSNPITVDVAVTADEKWRQKNEHAAGWFDAMKPLLESVTAWLVGLGALILAAGVVWWRLRNFGRKPEDDDPKPE
jgi:hypothetical protein